MAHPNDPVSFPTDPHPVRPGTSDALFARTIDATPQPRLIQAQETVAELIPRLTTTMSDPLFVAMLAGTLVLLWLAMRMRSRLRPVLLFGLIMMTLTSFRPAQGPVEAPNPGYDRDDPRMGVRDLGDDVIADGYERARQFERREAAPPIPEPAPFVRAPEPHPFSFRVPARPQRLRPDVDRIRQDEEELRRAIEELRHRIEAELRRRGEDRYYQTRAARWFRRLPPEIQQWVVERQRAVAYGD